MLYFMNGSDKMIVAHCGVCGSNTKVAALCEIPFCCSELMQTPIEPTTTQLPPLEMKRYGLKYCDKHECYYPNDREDGCPACEWLAAYENDV